MTKVTCFSDSAQLLQDSFNHKPFSINHNLTEHDSFSIESLAKVISELPEKQIIFSKVLEDSEIGSDFFNNPKSENYSNKGSLEKAIHSMETSNAFITVINPHRHPLFEGVFNSIMAEVEQHLGKSEKNKPRRRGEQSWLFIASPNAITPYHYDPSSNLLFQIKGEKSVKVFPPRHTDILSQEAYEDVLTVGPPKVTGYTEELDYLGEEFNIKSGQGMHIPFTSGHYVRNGLEEVSITYSIFFQTNETSRWFNAAYFNKKFRPIFKKLGLRVRPVGSSKLSTNLKDLSMRIMEKLQRMIGIKEG